MQQSTIEQELESLPSNYIVFLLSEGNYENHLKVLKYLLSKADVSGIYITLNKPAKTVKENLVRDKVNMEKIYFIDLISERAGFGLETSEMLLTTSPSNLTDLSISLGTALENIQTKNKFVFFDTLSTLFNYNPEPLVLKFVHYLTASMRNRNAIGVFILIKKQLNERSLSILSGFGDKVIEV